MNFKTIGLLTMLFIMATIGFAQASNEVVVEYFHFSACQACQRVDLVIRNVESKYAGQVSVEWVDVMTSAGSSRFKEYGLTEVPAVVVNHEYAIVGDKITKERLEAVIEAYLHSSGPVVLEKPYLSVPLAFSLGLLSGVSPCLMAMLAFLLSYTASTSMKLREGLSRASAFGVGLVAAYLLMGCLVLFLLVSISNMLVYLRILTLMASLIIIAVGLNLVGVLRLPINTKPLVQRLPVKYASSLPGLFFLGILFSFVKVPCAAPFVFVLLANMLLVESLHGFLLLVFFSLGVLIPFLGVGLIGGGIPSLARNIRERYQRVIRVISGLILLGFGIWLLIP